MNVEQKIQALYKLLDKAKDVHVESNTDPEFISWKNLCERTFVKVFGENSKELEQLKSLNFTYDASVWSSGVDYSADYLRCFRRDFEILIKTINLLVEEFKDGGTSEEGEKHFPENRTSVIYSNKKANMYNLTPKQREILQWIVQKVREGSLDEEFSFIYLASGDIHFFGGVVKDVSNHPFLSEGVLDALMASGLIIVNKKDNNIVQCTLLGKAYDAVNSHFEEVVNNQNSPFYTSVFGSPNKKYTYDLFVLMPFVPELRPIYDDHIKKVAGDLNLSIARADDFFSQNSIMEEIWSAIAQASILIAECTNKNPNVFYEIGLAHAIGRPVILITQNPNDVPFDLQYRRYIQYSYTPPGMGIFERDLSSTIVETLKDLGKPV